MAADVIIQIDRNNPNGQKIINAIDHLQRGLSILSENKQLLSTAIGVGDGGEVTQTIFGIQVAGDASDDNGQAFADILLGLLDPAASDATFGARLKDLLGKISAKVS